MWRSPSEIPARKGDVLRTIAGGAWHRASRYMQTAADAQAALGTVSAGHGAVSVGAGSANASATLLGNTYLGLVVDKTPPQHVEVEAVVVESDRVSRCARQVKQSLSDVPAADRAVGPMRFGIRLF
jgi:hypothetical protein